MKTVTIEISKAYFDQLVKLANNYEDLPDDFSACDYSGGNFDDAFNMGQTYGQTTIAKELIDAMPEG